MFDKKLKTTAGEYPVVTIIGPDQQAFPFVKITANKLRISPTPAKNTIKKHGVITFCQKKIQLNGLFDV